MFDIYCGNQNAKLYQYKIEKMFSSSLYTWLCVHKKAFCITCCILRFAFSPCPIFIFYLHSSRVTMK